MLTGSDFYLAAGKFDTVGEDAHYEIVERDCQIGAFMAHLLEINLCQSIEGDRTVRGDGGRYENSMKLSGRMGMFHCKTTVRAGLDTVYAWYF
jgi:hypothetical protein